MVAESVEACSAAPAGTARAPIHGSYRRDIDGLRALAILPVILFHAHFFCPGGYVGVDVFFVISGYLITRVLEADLREGRFSVALFYQRRIRRIFPALFAVLAAAIAAGWWVLPPVELKNLARSVVASSLFSSNIMFFRRIGYFEASADSQPLLHTWTLSVEEQFYLFWPLLLALLSAPRWLKWKLPVMAGLFCGGLALSQFWVGTNPAASFYLLPSRAWELVLGAMLSVPKICGALERLPRRVASAASIAGLALLGFGFFGYSGVTPFPGIPALAPCLGAAFLIAAGEGGETVGSRILSCRALVWTGLISYSLYLWHWPILVFGRVILNYELPAAESGILVLITFAAAWLSWRFVESPFRRLHGVSNRSWLAAGIATTVFFAGIGAVLYFGRGWPARAPAEPPWLSEIRREGAALQAWPCLARGASLPDGCLLGAPSPDGRYDAVLWGDSHAAQLAPVLDEAGKHLGITARLISKAGCPPFPGIRFFPADNMRGDCPAFNASALRAILEDGRVRAVVLAARWDYTLTGAVRLSASGGLTSVEESNQLIEATLRHTIETLVSSGRRVTLIGQVPVPSDVVECVSRAQFRNQPAAVCSAPRQLVRLTEAERMANRMLHAATADAPGVPVIDPYENLCTKDGCSVMAGGHLLYVDETHLSPMGAFQAAAGLERTLSMQMRAAEQPKPGHLSAFSR